ncbi:hypothetical protein [Nocardia sp. IFM 10818]
MAPRSSVPTARTGGADAAVRPALLATFPKRDLAADVPDLAPHIHASQGS